MNWLDFLWLFLAVAGLGLLWLLIMGIEKLAERLRQHDEARRMTAENIAERTAAAEADFLRQQNAKARAKAYIETADFSNENDPEQDAQMHEAMQTLSSHELVQSVAKRMFGAPKSVDNITADQSALDPVQSRKVLAKGNGVTPVKVKSSSKSALSKSEQKMLKKIKQGY